MNTKVTEALDTRKIAKLANLSLTEEEINKFTLQLVDILNYIEQLNQVDTSNIEPTFNVSGQSNVELEDKLGECLSAEDALSNAPKKQGSFFVTKGVFEAK